MDFLFVVDISQPEDLFFLKVRVNRQVADRSTMDVDEYSLHSDTDNVLLGMLKINRKNMEYRFEGADILREEEVRFIYALIIRRLAGQINPAEVFTFSLDHYLHQQIPPFIIKKPANET